MLEEERLVPVLRGAEPRSAALVGLAVQDPPAGAALRRDVRGGAVVPAPARRAARGHGRGLPPLRRCRSRRGDAEDVHWAVQHELVERLPIGHVGRLERLDETLRAPARARRRRALAGERRQENRRRVAAAAVRIRRARPRAALNGHYAEDFEHYGYDPATAAADADGMREMERARRSAPPDHARTRSKSTTASGSFTRSRRRVQFLEERLEGPIVAPASGTRNRRS